MDAKKTPLYDEHIRMGGKVVDYAGWYLPIQYEGLVPEHNAVRNKVGLFDVSHMGLIIVKGKDALAFVDYLVTNDVSKSKDNRITYTFMCQPDGGVVDDFLYYRVGPEHFYLVVNAANIEKDYNWILKHKGDFDVEVTDVSPQTGILALQGPLAEKTLQKITEKDLSQMKFFSFDESVDINGVDVMLSRNGYTGEDGFEIYAKSEDIVKVWKDLFKAGEEEGIVPTGLGCRDTLRFEASLPLYGHEISETITPLEGGFKFFVKLDKESDFIGKEALTKQWEAGLERELVGFELLGRGIPREEYEVQKDGKKIGHVTTGYMSPTLKKSIGNALISTEFRELGTEIDIMIRNKPVKAKVIDKDFLKNK